MASTLRKTTEPALAGSAVLSVELDGFAIRGTPILGALALEVARGETVALTGPSGIGKTTLLRIIAGLESGYHGKVRLRGVPAVVFQEPTLLRWRTLAQNLCLATRISERDALDHLARVGLADKADLFPDQLSLGQQRRLSLARAFALRPDILLMDEPFGALDEMTRERMPALTISSSTDLNPAKNRAITNPADCQTPAITMV